MKKTTLAAFIAASSLGLISASAVSIAVSTNGPDDANRVALAGFLASNFSNVELSDITFGDFTTVASLPAGTEIAIIGRRVSSSAFSNTTNSQAWNAATIPVISLTSFVSRTDGSRWGWHSGSTAGGSIAGADTTITPEGSSAGLGLSGAVLDFYEESVSSSSTINASGAGTVGGGEILATIDGNIAVAQWQAGDAFGGEVGGGTSAGTAGAYRLLFNTTEGNTGGNDRDTALDITSTLTAAGESALISLLDANTSLEVVPEPSVALLGLLGVAGLLRRRR